MKLPGIMLKLLAIFGLAVPGFAGDAPLHEEIDRLMAAGTVGPVAGQSSDAEFLRRVTLDLAGTIPTSDEARQFPQDVDADKRTRLVDRLLAGSDYARRMQQALTVMLLERHPGTTITDREWNGFVEKSFAANKRWDQFVRELVAADGRGEQTRAAIRFFVDGGRSDHHLMTQDVARIFLGMNIQCAQCHDHPNVEAFRQADYFGLYAYLAQSVTKTDTQLKKPFLVENVATGKVDFQSVFFPDMLQATGNLPRVLKAPIPEQTTFTYKDYSNGRIPPPENLPDVLTLFGATFGNPPGEAEVDFRPSVQHSLFLMNEQLVLHWLEPRDGNLIDRLARISEPDTVADELYLSVYARLPDEEERGIVVSYLQTQSDRHNETLGELAWALLTSAEFRLNH